MNVIPASRRATGSVVAKKRPEAGQTLLGHAVELIEERQWKPALDVLESARRLRPNDPVIDELTVIAASHARRRKPLRAALAKLEEREELGASAYHAQAVAALVDHRYAKADALARKSIEADPSSPAGWADLAASFAGLGWFDQASDCLTIAAEKGGVAPTQHWRLGHAVNHWALAGSGALLITAAATVLVGLLALAVGLSSTILVREIRVHHLPEPFKGAAEWQWRSEHLIKISFGLGVLLSVTAFVAAQIYLSGAS